MKFTSITDLPPNEQYKQGGYQIDGNFNLYDATPTSSLMRMLVSSRIIGSIARWFFGYIEISGTDVVSGENPQPQKVIFVKRSSFVNQLTDAMKLRYGCDVCFSDKVARSVINNWMTNQAKAEKEKEFKPVPDLLESCYEEFRARMLKIRTEEMDDFLGIEHRFFGILWYFPSAKSDSDEVKELFSSITPASFPDGVTYLRGELKDGRFWLAVKDKTNKVGIAYEVGPGKWEFAPAAGLTYSQIPEWKPV